MVKSIEEMNPRFLEQMKKLYDPNLKPKSLRGLVEKEEVVGKIITIRTLRVPYSYPFAPKGINYRGYISEIEFSHPISDYESKEQKKLILKTSWFKGSFNRNPYWNQWLCDEKEISFGSADIFGYLGGDFDDYSGSELKEWQEQALREHKRTLDRIEELYYQTREVKIPEDFLKLDI